MHTIINDLKIITEQGTPSVICIVTATTGSTPRKTGSKMIVFQDGSIKGTIGGGSIEYQVIQEAIKMISCGTPFTKHFELNDDLQMQCSGTMDVYFEAIGCLPKLYIFGAGHIGKALAGYTPALGFRPIVFDQRDHIYDSWDLAKIECRTGDFLQAIDSLEFDNNTYIVIVTHQHELDEKILFKCATRDYAYLGMIGSKRKIAEIAKKAIENKILSPEQLERIDMPIGLPFAAETPAEIAISIVAKMIDVKNTLKKS